LIKEFLDMVPVDGLWIDMNEPASFCNGDCSLDKDTEDVVHQLVLQGKNNRKFDPRNPRYRINNFGSEAPLHYRTVSPEVTHFDGTLEYDAHNIYGK
jgi:alpha-D-xyloside xylohydrolase